MPIQFNSFTPSTRIQSADVNTNFNTIETFLEGLRPAVHFYVPDLQIVASNISGELTIKTVNTLYLSAVFLRAKTAPTGAAMIVDINKNGSTIFSNRPQIAIGATTGGSAAVFTGSNPTIADGDVLTVDMDQVGSTEPGRDITVTLVFTF